MASLKVNKKSPSFSFDGWDIWEFVKGRKKTVVTIVGFILGLVMSDSVTVATVAAALVEMGFAIGEYYVKRK